jgi:peptidoglycan-associated lipoprotein
MKNITFVFALVISAALVLTTSGCKHSGVNKKPIPGITHVPGEDVSSGSMPNGQDTGIIPTTVHSGDTSTIPVEIKPEASGTNGEYGFNASKWDPKFTGPHTENRDIFAAYTVYFELDSSVIRSGEDSKLENIAKYFATNTKDVLMVEGHCDERGTEQYNTALGDRRALAVREYLIKLGVESGRIRTVSYGESRPVDPGHNEEAWKKNRRGVSVLFQPIE